MAWSGRVRAPMGHLYRLETRLETGQLSDLFRGRADGQREVQLKLFTPQASDHSYGKALHDASARVASLKQAGVMHHEEVGLVGGRLCVARPHIDGYHLGTALMRLATKEVVLPPAVALFILTEVCTAVAAAHAAGFAHGAITPANIWVARDGRVWVTDFLALWAMKQSPVMGPLADKGRNGYRAPEVARAQPADSGSDVYSLGAVLYELLTLRSVFASRGGGLSTKRDELPAPSRLDRRVHAKLDAVVMRALEPQKSRRQKGAAELGEGLRNFLSSQGIGSGRPEVAKFVSEVFPNEVVVSGIGGELPLQGDFRLEKVVEGKSLPGVVIDLAPRSSYSSTAIPVLSELGDPVSLLEAEAQTAPVAPVAQPAASIPVASIPAGRPRFETWDAPVGQLDPAVSRRLSQPNPMPAPLSAEQLHAPTQEMAVLPPMQQEPLPRGLRNVSAGSSRNSKQGEIRRPRAEAPEETGTGPTVPGWHAPIGPKRVPERIRMSLGHWLLGTLVAAGVAVLLTRAVMRKAGMEPDFRSLIAASDDPVPPVAPSAPVPAKPPPGPAPRPPDAQPQADAPSHATTAEPRAARHCLNLRASAAAQLMYLDGVPVMRALPLEDYEVPAGARMVTVVRTGQPDNRVNLTLNEDDLACGARAKPRVVVFKPAKGR